MTREELRAALVERLAQALYPDWDEVVDMIPKRAATMRANLGLGIDALGILDAAEAFNALIDGIDAMQIAHSTGDPETAHSYTQKVLPLRTAARAALRRLRGEP